MNISERNKRKWVKKSEITKNKKCPEVETKNVQPLSLKSQNLISCGGAQVAEMLKLYRAHVRQVPKCLKCAMVCSPSLTHSCKSRTFQKGTWYLSNSFLKTILFERSKSSATESTDRMVWEASSHIHNAQCFLEIHKLEIRTCAGYVLVLYSFSLSPLTVLCSSLSSPLWLFDHHT